MLRVPVPPFHKPLAADAGLDVADLFGVERPDVVSAFFAVHRSIGALAFASCLRGYGAGDGVWGSQMRAPDGVRNPGMALLAGAETRRQVGLVLAAGREQFADRGLVRGDRRNSSILRPLAPGIGLGRSA